MKSFARAAGFISMAAMFASAFAGIWTLDWRWAASATVFVCLAVFFGVMRHGDDPS